MRPRAVFRLQTLFAPATWAVDHIVPYGPPAVNNSVHARNRRVLTEIGRDPPTSLKAASDPCILCFSEPSDLVDFRAGLGGAMHNI